MNTNPITVDDVKVVKAHGHISNVAIIATGQVIGSVYKGGGSNWNMTSDVRTHDISGMRIRGVRFAGYRRMDAVASVVQDFNIVNA